MIQQLRLEAGKLIADDGRAFACTVGRAGVTDNKQEGDLKTPKGQFPLRCCYYRPDRLPPPETQLPVIALSVTDGWCDDPADAMYNKPVKLPFAARHEKLWRDDTIYDLVIPLGYNDDPVVAGKGSAIFLHLMRDDGVGTEGCIALKRADLLAILPELTPQTLLIV